MHTYIVRFISSFQRILYVSLSRLCLSNNNFNNETLLLSEIIFYHLCLVCLSRVQLISAARQYNQSVIMRHLLWSNTVLFDSGLVKNLEYSLLPSIFFLFCIYLSACPPVYLCATVRSSISLSVYSSVRPSVRAPISLYVCACRSSCLSACPSVHLRALERTQKIMYLRHSNKHTYLMICTLNGLHTYRCFCSRYAMDLRAVCSFTAIQRSHYPKVYHICSSLIRVYMRRFFSSAHSISFYRCKRLVQTVLKAIIVRLYCE